MSAEQATNLELKDEEGTGSEVQHAPLQLETFEEKSTTIREPVSEESHACSVPKANIMRGNANTNDNELVTSTSLEECVKVKNTVEEKEVLGIYHRDRAENVSVTESGKKVEIKEKESEECSKGINDEIVEKEHQEDLRQQELEKHELDVKEVEAVKEENSESKEMCEESLHLLQELTENSVNVESSQSSEQNINNSNLFIRNLSPEVDQNDLESVFRPFGKILSSVVIRNIYTGVSLGTGFVRFETHEQAQRAMHTLNTRLIAGRPFCIQWANKHEGAPVGEARKKIHKLFVRNIPFDLTIEQLKEFFSQFGPVSSVTIHNDTVQTVNKELERRISFITFEEDGAADKASKAIHNTQPFPSCNNIPLMVKLAEDVYNKSEHRRRHHHSSNMHHYFQAHAQVQQQQQQQRQTRPYSYSVEGNRNYYSDSISYSREYSPAQPPSSSSSAATAAAVSSNIYANTTNHLCNSEPSSNMYGNQEQYALYDEDKAHQMSYWDNSRHLSSAISSTPAITTNAYTELTAGNETQYYPTGPYSIMEGGGQHRQVMGGLATTTTTTAITQHEYNLQQQVPMQVQPMYSIPSMYGQYPSQIMYDVNSMEAMNASSSNVATAMYVSYPPFSPSPPQPIVLREQSRSYYQPSTSFLRAEESYGEQQHPYVAYSQEYNLNYVNCPMATSQPNVFSAVPSTFNMYTGYYPHNTSSSNIGSGDTIIDDNPTACPSQKYNESSELNMQMQTETELTQRRSDNTTVDNVIVAPAGAGAGAGGNTATPIVSSVKPNVVAEAIVVEREQFVHPMQTNSSSQVMQATPTHTLPFQPNVSNICESHEMMSHHHIAPHSSPRQTNASRRLSFSHSTSNANAAVYNVNDSNWLRPVAEDVEQPLPTPSPLCLDSNQEWEQEHEEEHQKVRNVMSNKNVKCFDSPLKTQTYMETNTSVSDRNRSGSCAFMQSQHILNTADDFVDNVINVPQTSFQCNPIEQSPSLHSTSSSSEVPLKMALPTYSKCGQKLVHHLSLNEYSSSSGKECREADTFRSRVRESSMGSPNQSYRHNPYNLTSSVLICEDKPASSNELLATCVSPATNESNSKQTTESEIANEPEVRQYLQEAETEELPYKTLNECTFLKVTQESIKVTINHINERSLPVLEMRLPLCKYKDE